jgi:hypothetical protein
VSFLHGFPRTKTLSSLIQDASGLLGQHAPALKRLVPAKQRARVWAVFFRALPTAGKTATFARWFRSQAAYCRDQGSPLYADLLGLIADDIEKGGPCWAVVETYAANGKLPPAATPLAFMAAVHQVVLEERGSALEPYYPSTGGNGDATAAGPALLEVVSLHGTRVRELLTRPVQTNEVARSRVLLGGHLLVASRTGLPLRVLEFGASAGLNLRWDHFRYEIGDAAWGDPESPVRLTGGYLEGVPPVHLRAEVAERLGSDFSPIDPNSPDGQIKLLSHVWADQTERLEQLRAAFEVAGRVDAPVEQADALAWVRKVLAARAPGSATVIFDTCMMEYLDPAVREEIRRTIEQAGERADARSPLAWLHLAPGADGGEEQLHLTSWPGGTRELLASCDPYGRRVRWLGPAA